MRLSREVRWAGDCDDGKEGGGKLELDVRDAAFLKSSSRAKGLTKEPRSSAT